MNRPNQDNFAAWNEEMAQRHDPDLYHTQSPLPIRLIERRRVQVIINLLKVQQEHRILEVGCGAGNVLEQVGPSKRIGVDISTFLLGKSQQRLGSNASLVQMNAEQLAFSDHSFDRIYCTEVLEHVLHPKVVLSEMKRVLKPDGVAVVSVPNEGMINRIKNTVLAIPGARALLKKSGNYDMPDHMEDEWHLHEFELEMLKDSVQGLFDIDCVKGIPSRLLPLRWVARLRPS
ncbi:MAG TPA: methyltransferase domain-containing protein [Myxococcales bacterium]|nr:methyltransferase domain-containing protein [Myxococcales bacterium]HIN85271.1 methyltransferase domain-containing protein [Myxococcales bacterium]